MPICYTEAEVRVMAWRAREEAKIWRAREDRANRIADTLAVGGCEDLDVLRAAATLAAEIKAEAARAVRYGRRR